jgi:hypothetical protein
MKRVIRVVGNYVTVEKIEVAVPRCPTCRSVHDKNDVTRLGRLGLALVASAVVTAVVYYTFGSGRGAFWGFWGAMLVFTRIFDSERKNVARLKRRGIRSAFDVDGYPPIAQAGADGWKVA